MWNMIKSTEDGTTFDYHFYLKHKSYKNLTHLESEIRDIENEIEKTKQKNIWTCSSNSSCKTFRQYMGYNFGYSKDIGG